jgi:molybdenum cofactor cytidylyltransferase
MIFGKLPVAKAVGAILGHSLVAGKKHFKKGDKLTPFDIAQIEAAGIHEVIAAQIETDDVGEDEAAARIAEAAAGSGAKASAAFTGRANIYAETSGLVLIDREGVDRLNLVDEAITIATLSPFEAVSPGQMLATVKIIPFAAKRSSVERCAAIAGSPLLRVAAFRPHRAGLIVTHLPGTKESVLAKTEAAVAQRLETLGSTLGASLRCPHREEAIAQALRDLTAQGLSPLLVFGASAIVDRRDVIPAAIIAAGGSIDHFGMPVDPGNLLLIGRAGATPVVGLPGCARSPKLNGFDWVLQRLLAEVAVRGEDLMRMGVGGLLKEVPRPMPREAAALKEDQSAAPRMPRIAALVLAAGSSRRMGRDNKLLQPIAGRAIVARVVDAVLGSAVTSVIVVLGHEADRVRAALGPRPVTFVENPTYTEGLATSLKAGLEAVAPGIDGVLICLGDMPAVGSAEIDTLIAAFNPTEGRAICVPTYDGKRGNPVLWAAKFIPEMKTVAGDVGAKHLIGEHEDELREVPMPGPGILLDIDTPEALADARVRPL